jgi:cytoskeleton protein RodZ
VPATTATPGSQGQTQGAAGTAPLAVGPGALTGQNQTGLATGNTTGGAPTAVQAGMPPATQFAALPPGKVYGSKNHDARVVLRIHAPTRLLVLGPKKVVLINQTLQTGDIYQVPNQVGLTLTTPNGGAVELDLDGAPMGFAGRDQGMTEDLSLDPQSIVDRYNGGRG